MRFALFTLGVVVLGCSCAAVAATDAAESRSASNTTKSTGATAVTSLSIKRVAGTSSGASSVERKSTGSEKTSSASSKADGVMITPDNAGKRIEKAATKQTSGGKTPSVGKLVQESTQESLRAGQSALRQAVGAGEAGVTAVASAPRAVVDRAVDTIGYAFNTDYKTRPRGAYAPDLLCGKGWDGKNLPIGQEDEYRKCLPRDYMPTDLVRLSPQVSYYNEPYYLRREAAASLERMCADAARQGYRLQVYSAYRDFNHQSRLRRQSGGSGMVAKPGQSEHALGTTVDVTSTERYVTSRAFAKTPEGRWLQRNACRYGWCFSLETRSGGRTHNPEPWHVRYMGGGGSLPLLSLPWRVETVAADRGVDGSTRGSTASHTSQVQSTNAAPKKTSQAQHTDRARKTSQTSRAPAASQARQASPAQEPPGFFRRLASFVMPWKHVH